jgi:hypothetical protein
MPGDLTGQARRQCRSNRKGVGSVRPGERKGHVEAGDLLEIAGDGVVDREGHADPGDDFGDGRIKWQYRQNVQPV